MRGVELRGGEALHDVEGGGRVGGADGEGLDDGAEGEEGWRLGGHCCRKYLPDGAW